MRLCLLLCLALIFAGCTSNASVQPTRRGPVVPTRVIPPTATPSDTPTNTPSPTDTPTPTDTNTAPPPTDTATVPPPTDTPEPTDTNTVPPPTDTPRPTDTPEPTNTTTAPPPTDQPAPTDTPEPTNTTTAPPPTDRPAPTDTPELTNTPTYTPSPTSLPTAEPLSEPVLFGGSTSLVPTYIYAAVVLNEMLYGTIDDQHAAGLFIFDGTAGMVIDISMEKQERGDLDPFLLVLDPKGREIARNDDIDEEHHDSAIRGLTLPADGTYFLVATRFAQDFGETSGDFGLVVRESAPGTAPTGSFSQATGYDALVTGALDNDTPEQVYTFRATAGDVVTIQMTKSSGDLDTNLTLTNNLGSPLVSNDDNLLTGSLDSAIQGYVIPRSGYYTLLAGRYSGSDNSGSYRLKIALDSRSGVGIDAILDPVNSTTVTDEGAKFTGYTIGDQLDENGQERTLQVLLTFRLPPNEELRSVHDAVLELLPCLEEGGGFETLGVMTIYQDNYGKISQARNLTHPLPGARILGTQDSCDPVDLTELVDAAYQNAEPNIQLRLILRSHSDNGQEDYVQITPGLHVEFGD